jgi:DNA mismatch repair protein MutS
MHDLTTAPRSDSASPPDGDSKIAAPAVEMTPMLAHYRACKERHPDHLLFYRMGDFYEMFFEDAVQAAGALDITLTRRGKVGADEVPMAGVPVKAHEAYLERLIRKGFKVAICEQVEDPSEAKKRGGKTLVRREIVRLVTPGTLTEDTLLDARRHNYLAALAEAAGEMALAWLDMSTGDFAVEPVAPPEVAACLARLDPGELLLPDRLLQRPDLFETFRDWKTALTPLPSSRFDSSNAKARLQSLYGVGTLDAFGDFGRAEHAACGAVVDYVELTQQGRLPRLAPPRRMSRGGSLAVDAATRRNLELTRTLTGERRGSLLDAIDRTVAGAGARLLAEWLSAPLTDAAAINARLDAVGWFVEGERIRTDLRAALRRCPDVERALSRLSVGRGGPRDLAAVRDALRLAAELRALLEQAADAGLAGLPDTLAAAARDLGHHAQLVDRLSRVLGPDLPLLARDGGFVASGYAAELDELRTLRDDSRRLVAELQGRYARETGVSGLKVRHNNVLGYFVETNAANAPKLQADSRFIHRQTLASAMRFGTVELGDLESRIAQAADRAMALELELFETLVKDVEARADEIARAAGALARLDVAAALGELAVEQNHVRPRIDDGLGFRIVGGRHPVVEAALTREGKPFVANDCALGEDAGRLWLVTGPNMAGKSTFLRQNALIALMAQMGAFVPAAEAEIGVVDRLFSRVGAADDLARGRSTFMVEMVEAAAILNQATERSLVILDEIGRGTATFDGLSIAWACVEHLHEANRCRALFATHYHELTSLAGRLPRLALRTMRVKEWQGDVVFLHEVAEGAADRSYGIHVGRLAGLPAAVVARAEEVLKLLESGDQGNAVARLAEDLPLFAAARKAPPKPAQPDGFAEPAASPALDALAALNPDELTPRAALDALYRLKELAGRS